MTLKCVGVCTNVIRVSQSPAFKNIKVGDKMLFSCELTAAGYRFNRQTNAKYLTCTNLKTGETSVKSFNELAKIFDTMYRFVEVTDSKIGED